MTARLFELVRHVDVSGVSGTGIVAEGIEYADGGIALRWKGEWPATAVWPSMKALLAIHGHDGKTTVRYLAATMFSGDRILAGRESGLDLVGLVPQGTAGWSLHAIDAESWLQWLEYLGGSIDAAIKSERKGSTKYPWQWNWTTPDGFIHVFFITGDPDQIKPEAG